MYIQTKLSKNKKKLAFDLNKVKEIKQNDQIFVGIICP